MVLARAQIVVFMFLMTCFFCDAQGLSPRSNPPNWGPLTYPNLTLEVTVTANNLGDTMYVKFQGRIGEKAGGYVRLYNLSTGLYMPIVNVDSPARVALGYIGTQNRVVIAPGKYRVEIHPPEKQISGRISMRYTGKENSKPINFKIKMVVDSVTAGSAIGTYSGNISTEAKTPPTTISLGYNPNRAPKGGAMVNGVFYKGGQFTPYPITAVPEQVMRLNFRLGTPIFIQPTYQTNGQFNTGRINLRPSGGSVNPQNN